MSNWGTICQRPVSQRPDHGAIIGGSLRPYQQAGIDWLAFLRRFGLNGILCDDMGRSDIGRYGARSTRGTSTDLQRGDAVNPVLKQRQVYHHAGIDPGRTEMSNLAQAKPDLAKRLAGDRGEWAKRTGLRR